MSEPIPGTAPVKDQRTQPRGVLPKHAQTWVMVAVAVGILVIILFTGQSTPPESSPQATPDAPTTPDTAGLRQYQERLRLLNEQVRTQSTETPEQVAMPTEPPSPDYTPVDPLESERKRLDYQSRFARMSIPSRLDLEKAARTPSSITGDEIRPSGDTPSLDTLADAVIRATARAGQEAPDLADGTSASLARSAPASGPSSSANVNATDDGQHRYHLREGTVIPAVLAHRLDGSSAGPVKCLVTSPVYASTERRVLIPAGSLVLGQATPVQSFGETRLGVAFHRLLLPDDSSHPLDRSLGLNQRGDAGLRDRVDQHYVSAFGAAAAVGLIHGLSQAFGTSALGSQGGGPVIVTGTASETSAAATKSLEWLLNRPPTVTIREGHRVHIYLTGDIELPPYADAGTHASPTRNSQRGR